jgi:hypothetical protein
MYTDRRENANRSNWEYFAANAHIQRDFLIQWRPLSEREHHIQQEFQNILEVTDASQSK